MRCSHLLPLLLLQACPKPQDTGVDTDARPCLEGSSPDTEEVCDGIDNDCDGAVDEDPVDASTWYPDADGDGWGLDSDTVQACEAPAGMASRGGDCDDTDTTFHPDAQETCDGRDQDCDGTVDDDPNDGTPWYPDVDGDGWGNTGALEYACEPIAGAVQKAGDCDDDDPAVNPDAHEVCNDTDDDCDSTVDEDVPAEDLPVWYNDADGDGYGKTAAATRACDAPSGSSATGGDCDDGDPAIHPGASETCNGLDDNCSGVADEGLGSATTWYADVDGDGHGTATTTRTTCAPPPGYVSTSDDCDDGAASVYPSAPEVCDGRENDCSGTWDESLEAGLVTWFLDGGGTEDLTDDLATSPFVLPTSGEVVLCPGTWNVLLTVTEPSRVRVSSLLGSDSVTLDALGTGTVLTVEHADAEVSVVGLTLRGGAGEDGGGVSLEVGSLSLAGCVLEGNSATGSGGAVYVGGGTLSLSGTDLSDNSATLGGALYVSTSATARASDTRFTSNTAEEGGAIHSGGSLTLDGATLEGNWATTGGGLRLEDGTISLSSCSFDGNWATDGGGIWASGVDSLSVVESSLSGNTATTGGALYLDTIRTLVTLHDILVEANAATTGAGAWVQDSALSCAASTGATAGFLANVGSEEPGSVGIVVLATDTSSLVSEGCDWGTEGGDTDNVPWDVTYGSWERSYEFGDDAAFTCEGGRCE